MKKNIFITWTSKWIWKFLASQLKEDHEVLEVLWKKHIDLTQKSDILHLIEFIQEKKVVFDVLILNAWVWEFWKFEDHDMQNYETVLNLNLLANIRLLKWLQNSVTPKTKIIFIWSIISKKFMKHAAVYQASKFWVRWLAGWLKSEGKKVFLVNPKIVHTDFHKGKIELDESLPQTKLKDIWKTIQEIISGKEKRFEIDL